MEQGYLPIKNQEFFALQGHERGMKEAEMNVDRFI